MRYCDASSDRKEWYEGLNISDFTRPVLVLVPLKNAGFCLLPIRASEGSEHILFRPDSVTHSAQSNGSHRYCLQ